MPMMMTNITIPPMAPPIVNPSLLVVISSEVGVSVKGPPMKDDDVCGIPTGLAEEAASNGAEQKY